MDLNLYRLRTFQLQLAINRTRTTLTETLNGAEGSTPLGTICIESSGSRKHSLGRYPSVNCAFLCARQCSSGEKSTSISFLFRGDTSVLDDSFKGSQSQIPVQQLHQELFIIQDIAYGKKLHPLYIELNSRPESVQEGFAGGLEVSKRHVMLKTDCFFPQKLKWRSRCVTCMRLLTPPFNRAGETGIPKIESIQFTLHIRKVS